MRFFAFLIFFLMTLNIHAQASDSIVGGAACNTSAMSNEQVLAQNQRPISRSALLSAAWPCAKGILMGAWEATGGLVVSAAKCVWSLAKCARQAMKALSNAYDFFFDITTNVSNAFAALSTLPPAEKASIICGIIGGVGTDILLVILTAGAASGKLALTLSRITMKLTKLARIGKRLVGLPLGKLSKLSQKLLNKVDDMVKSGYGDHVRDMVRRTCPI